MTLAEQADILRGLERAQSRQTAARSRVLAAFVSGGGLEADGQCSSCSWLVWQARVTRGAAAAGISWMKRLGEHPLVDDALAAGQISESWAYKICRWSDKLPADNRADADKILLAAAAGGADLADLSALAEEMFRRCAPPDTDDDDDGFAGRGVRLRQLFRGQGDISGDLTVACFAMLSEVFDTLGKKAGPEDDRTQDQRHHDSLEEMCRLLLASGCLPERAGQPAQVQLHLTLDDARGRPGGAAAEAAWTSSQRDDDVPGADRDGNGAHPGDGVGDGPRGGSGSGRAIRAAAAGAGEPGWLTGKAAEAYACDAKIAPIVSGHVNLDVLDQMTAAYLAWRPPSGGLADQRDPATLPCAPGRSCAAGQPCDQHGVTGPSGSFGRGRPDLASLPPRTWKRLRDTLLWYAADLLSGPAGLASFVRSGVLAGEFQPTISLTLDTGQPTEEVPAHLRRAVIARDRHCRFPGCRQRPVRCHVHHIRPRAKGGVTRLTNLILLCSFHHLIAVHRWGWTITLHADGTVSAVSPDGGKTFHSHGPPPGHEPP